VDGCDFTIVIVVDPQGHAPESDEANNRVEALNIC
jgi:hypothetical protein